MSTGQQEFNRQEPQLKKEVVPVPRTVARAFGKWYEQRLPKSLGIIETKLKDADAVNQDPNIKQFIQEMGKKLPEIQEITTRLANAETVKLEKTESGNDKFVFLGENDSPLTPGDYLLDPEFQERFAHALSHNIGTPNSALVGYSELIKDRYQDNLAHQSALEINKQAKKIDDLLKPIVTIDAKKMQVKITVSENEIVDVSLIPRPEPETEV